MNHLAALRATLIAMCVVGVGCIAAIGWSIITLHSDDIRLERQVCHAEQVDRQINDMLLHRLHIDHELRPFQCTT